MTAHTFYLFLSIFLSPFIPLCATVTRPILSILAKAVNYQTYAKRMAGRPEENLEKCAEGGMKEIWRGRFTFFIFEAST